MLPKNEVVDSDALIYQVRGGMLSNFRNQLKEQKMEDRFEEVFAEIPVVLSHRAQAVKDWVAFVYEAA